MNKILTNEEITKLIEVLSAQEFGRGHGEALLEILFSKPCNITMLCKLMDLTPRRVDQLQNDGIVSKSGHGEYNLAESLQAYIRQLRTQAASHGGPELTVERSKKIAAERELAELKLAEVKGELVRADEVRTEAFNEGRRTRGRVLNVPGRISAQLAAEQDQHKVEAILAAELRQCLDTLAGDDPPA